MMPPPTVGDVVYYPSCYKYYIYNKVECPHCLGDGELMRLSGEKFQCKACDGSGKTSYGVGEEAINYRILSLTITKMVYTKDGLSYEEWAKGYMGQDCLQATSKVAFFYPSEVVKYMESHVHTEDCKRSSQ